MVVVDVETTGTDPHLNSIVSIGAIDFDNPTVQFYEECRIWDGAHIEPEALVVNGFSETAITDPNKPEEGIAISHFFSWLEGRGNKIMVAQNPLFDFGFLLAGANRHHLNFNLARRTIDLHTVAFVHMVKRGISPPTKNGKSDINSDSIMEYVGISAEPKPHIALNGAIWEAEALSRLLYGRFLVSQFEKFPVPF